MFQILRLGLFFLMALSMSFKSFSTLRPSTMNVSKKIPYGISSFGKMVEEKFLFFDRTHAIEDLENSGSYLKIWRPRRSGKSLFCSQLALYYDKGKTATTMVFDNTYIGKNPTSNKASFLVLFLSFSNVGTTGNLLDNFRDHINSMVLDFSNRYREILKKDIVINTQNHVNSMENLFNVVREAEEKVYLIVDEYDSFTNRLLLEVDTISSDLGLSHYLSTVADKEAMLRNFGNVLKTATMTVLSRMFFTGVTPMAFCDGLSSLNMVKDISDSPKFEMLFGFTEDEIKVGLQQVIPGRDSDIASHLEIMRDNFNGYRFNRKQAQSVFNPQMCLYYLDRLQEYGEPPAPLLDPNIATPADNVAQFLVKNYRGINSIGALDFLRYKVGVPVEITKEIVTFRSQDLFDVRTVDAALLALAYHHGYLTYCDPSDLNRLGFLVSPNKVYQEIFLAAIFSEKKDSIIEYFGLSANNTASNGLRKKIITAFKGKLTDYSIDKILEYLTRGFV